MTRDPVPSGVFRATMAACFAVFLLGLFDFENHGPFSVRQIAWGLLALLIALEISIARETWLAYRTKEWRWTLFLPRAYTRYFSRQSKQYWYRASLIGGIFSLLFCGAMIAVVGAGLWKGVY